MLLKVTAKLKTGELVTNDGLIHLDGILCHAWCVINAPHLLEVDYDEDNTIDIKLPIIKINDWYKVSFAFFEILNKGLKYFHKKFDPNYAEKYIDFGKKSGLINIKSDKYKNYRVPLLKILTNKVYWYCDGDKDEIEKLLGQITHIGKKTSQGFGEVLEWIVEDTKEDLTMIRAIPKKGGRIYTSYKPPYFYYKNFKECDLPYDSRLGRYQIFNQTRV